MVSPTWFGVRTKGVDFVSTPFFCCPWVETHRTITCVPSARVERVGDIEPRGEPLGCDLACLQHARAPQKKAARTRGPLNATLTEHQHRKLGLAYLAFAAWRRRNTQPRARKAPIEAIVAGSGVAVRAATFTAPMSTANNTSLKSRSPPPSKSSKPRIK